MPGQLYGWTCSGCATEWTERAMGFSRGDDIFANRQAVVEAIGYDYNINPTYGLMDGSGTELIRVLGDDTGAQFAKGQLSFDDVYALGAVQTPALMSGHAWYHWVAVRGVQGDTIYIANSAPGYKSVWSNLSRADWDRLGPFNCVWQTG